EELFSNPQHPYTQALLAAIPTLEPGSLDEAPAITGDPPSPLNIPRGCRFRTRCPLAEQICHDQDPELRAGAASAGHLAACHFAFSAAGAAAPLGPARPRPPARPSTRRVP